MEIVNYNGRLIGHEMVHFDVDFEMYGKDLTESAILSQDMEP